MESYIFLYLFKNLIHFTAGNIINVEGNLKGVRGREQKPAVNRATVKTKGAALQSQAFDEAVSRNEDA